MKFVPHDYQKYCIEYIKTHRISALLLDCGLGKTVITLTALNDLILDELKVSKVLVIAPLRVTYVWKAEIEKWDHLQYLDISLIVGTTKQRIAAINQNAFIHVVNRENVKFLVEYYEKNGLRWDFEMIVIDELSSFKNYQSQRFKWLRKVRTFVKRWVGLTGTPTSNGLMDLFAEIGILNGGERLGRFIGRFRESYFKPSSMNPSTGVVFSYVLRPGAEQQIYDKISDITISMKALDYLDMPECIFVNHEVEMNAAERKLYDQLKHDLIIPLEDGDIDAANAASLSNKLLQMANGAVYDENKEVRVIHSRKLVYCIVEN
ncbi:MAG: DEAD/DEAH box helicase family protein [Ruminococcus sp.]|nr:DEAD/DEAH box helicase family protein [Ruminococcus sp.]